MAEWTVHARDKGYARHLIFQASRACGRSHRVSWTDNGEGPGDDLLPQIKRRLGAICDARVLMTNARFRMVVPRPVGLTGRWCWTMGKIVCGNSWMRWSDGWFANVEFSLGAGA